MFATILFPETLKPGELDNFLANGWYRMGQSIFTTQFLCFKNCFYSAIWLRARLTDAGDSTTFKRLQKQNIPFKTIYKKAEITPQHESLYASYRNSIAFEPSETLHALLYGFTTTNCFNTYEINIYDGDTLIAAGFFDMGEKSAAGIVSFYHPAYKKYSLGKYLIYLKMNYCREQKTDYFYPGYVVPGYPPFDYKTTIGKETLQYFSVAEKQWLPYKLYIDDVDPLKTMRKKLDALQAMLSQKKSSSQVLYYRFFDASLDPYYSTDKLLDFPIFLYCKPLHENENFKLIVYDIRNENYYLIKCSSVLQTSWYQPVEGIFSSHLLKPDALLFSTPFAGELVTAVNL